MQKMTSPVADLKLPMTTPGNGEKRQELVARLKTTPVHEAASMLGAVDPVLACEALIELNPAFTCEILKALPDPAREAIAASAVPQQAAQWERNQACQPDTLGCFMEPTWAIFTPEMAVAEALEKLRKLVKVVFISYGYVVDPEFRLIGLVTMRELALADRGARIEDIMLRNVFVFRPDTPVSQAMRESLSRHYPVYPVCDEQGHLLGLVRGQAIFEMQAFEVTAQPGSMVGVDKEERISTPMWRSFKFRHPWLQLNLLTAFLAGAVVALFQGTIDKLVILAAFLPVLAGQSGNTGCQALAVTLRGITLGEITQGDARKLVMKEGLLGALNGVPVGVVSAAAMYAMASSQQSGNALVLALVVLLAMVGACTISGISGAIVPLTLKRCGADPATASSIFLTTATDIVSMGLLLGLATLLVVI